MVETSNLTWSTAGNAPLDIARGKEGILPAQMIESLIRLKVLQAGTGGDVDANQIQPASVDLRLGHRAWRVRASFLPGRHTVADRLKEFSLAELDLTNGFTFERGCFYIVELQEILKLPKTLSAAANPKSSTGRLDVFTRLIADKSEVFDWVEGGYRGKLYVEVCPITFSIRVRKGSRLNQLRFLSRNSGHSRYHRPILTDIDLRRLHRQEGLTSGPGDPTIRNGLNVRVDLLGKTANDTVGYRALPFAGVVDIDQRHALSWREYWEPVKAKKGRITLNPNEFYILASKERMRVPPKYAAEMAPIDPMMGEFRAHYAGFFDPGFGHMDDGDHGSRAVLEVRSHDVPFVLEDGQVIARLIYESLVDEPNRLYGRELGSNYQGQGLKLSKHFK